MSPQARSAELKSKAEREALRRAGMSRREHEKVMQQQRDAYRRRMNALCESERREMNERLRRRQRRQQGKAWYAAIYLLNKNLRTNLGSKCLWQFTFMRIVACPVYLILSFVR